MKKTEKLNPILTAILPFVCCWTFASTANADATFKCTIAGGQQGSATIEVLSVVSHPLLKVFKIELTTKLAKPTGQNGSLDGTAHLAGLLLAQIDNTGNVMASGLVSNLESTNGVIITPQNITLQGQGYINGVLSLMLYDTDRILQLGYGVPVNCQ